MTAWFVRDIDESATSPECTSLRAALSDHYGVTDAVLTSSGTAALMLAVRACLMPHRRKVIVPAWAPVPVWNAVVAAGGEMVPVDMDPDTLNMRGDLLHGSLFGDHFACVVAVHALGRPQGVSGAVQIARHRDIPVIEDQAAAFGTTSEVIGDVAILSFGSMKRLSCGQGGAVLCQDGLTAKRIYAATRQGFGAPDRVLLHGGFNYALDGRRARLLAERWGDAMATAARDEEHRRIMAEGWRGRFLMGGLYNCLMDEDGEAEAKLTAAGIPTRRQYPPISHHPVYCFTGRTFPGAGQVYSRLLFLPFGPDFTSGDARQIAACLKG